MDQHKPERLLRPAGGTAVAGTASMRLCAGTLVVDQPDQVLLDYLDVRNGYAYPAYDRLVTNGSAELVDGDLLAPALIGAHVDAGLFGMLDEPRYAGRGVRGTIVSKVLHRKRPDLVPMYDSRIFEAYTAPGVLPRTPERSWQEFMRLLCTQMRADLQAEAKAFDELQQAAEAVGAPITKLR